MRSLLLPLLLVALACSPTPEPAERPDMAGGKKPPPPPPVDTPPPPPPPDTIACVPGQPYPTGHRCNCVLYQQCEPFP